MFAYLQTQRAIRLSQYLFINIHTQLHVSATAWLQLYKGECKTLKLLLLKAEIYIFVTSVTFVYFIQILKRKY